MTTRELIALLQSKDPSGNMRVFVPDAEGGLVNIDITECEITKFALSDMPHTLKGVSVGEKVLVL